MTFKPYPKYKASGVEWLGDVPEHWDVRKLAHAIDTIGSGTTPKTDTPEFYENGEISWVNTGDLNDSELYGCSKSVSKAALDAHTSLKIYPFGSVVMAMYGATIGKLAILRFPATVNQACCVFVGEKLVHSKFLFYWLFGFRDQIVSLATGGGQPNISQEIIRTLRLACPNLQEQVSIAAFLDREAVKIDTLIAKQEAMIELLKEKRQAVISHAVTKGIDPSVPMKGSGVEWLGDVPEHWAIHSLKFVCDLIRDGTHLPPPRVDEGVPLLSVRNMVDGEFVLRSDDSMISEEDYALLCRSFTVNEGDVLLAIVGATLGKVALVRSMPRHHIQRSVAVLRSNPKKMSCRFLQYFLRSQSFQAQLWSGIGFSAQPGIYLGAITAFPCPVPVLEHQEEIVDYLDCATAKIDALIAKAQQAIALQKEHRTALISAAVTGKIDVRNEVAEREAA